MARLKDEMPEPLDELCAACSGAGKVVDPVWQQWREARKSDPNLRPPINIEEVTCSTCKGKGRIPTASGVKILALVKLHLGL